MSPTVYGSGYNHGNATVPGAGRQIAEAIAHELEKQFGYWPGGNESLGDQLSREIKRVHALLNPNHHGLIDMALQVVENEDELPMPELLKALRGCRA